MTDNSPIDSHNHSEKRSNPFKKIMSNVKSFMKNNVEEIDSSSLEASKTEKSPDSNILKYEKYKKENLKGQLKI